MKLSRLAIASSALEFRSRATQELNELMAAEAHGQPLAEIRFIGRYDNDPFRVFSDDETTTRLPFDQVAYQQFTQSIIATTKAYLMKEIDLCNRAITELGIEIDE